MAHDQYYRNDSGDLQLLPSKTDQRPLERTVQTSTKPDGLAKWGVLWTSPFLMTGFLLVGIGLAYGHHGYYHSLDDTLVTSTSQQQWVSRIGLGIAFLVKVTLAASIIESFEQYLWTTVRRTPVQLQGIDALFAMPHTLLSFFNFEVFSKAKVLAVIGIISW